MAADKATPANLWEVSAGKQIVAHEKMRRSGILAGARIEKLKETSP